MAVLGRLVRECTARSFGGFVHIRHNGVRHGRHWTVTVRKDHAAYFKTHAHSLETALEHSLQKLAWRGTPEAMPTVEMMTVR